MVRRRFVLDCIVTNPSCNQSVQEEKRVMTIVTLNDLMREEVKIQESEDSQIGDIETEDGYSVYESFEEFLQRIGHGKE